MEFTASLDNKISPGAREATADLIALRAALDDVDKAAGKARPPAPPKDKSANADAEKRIRESIAFADRVAVAQEKADKKEAKSRADADKTKEKSKSKSQAAASVKDAAKKVGGAAEVPLKFIAGAAGIAGLAGLTKMAIGYAGMAKLEAVSARLALNFRSLFKGVDPSPLIRGFEKFTQNFSLTTVTGRAFGDIMTRAFNGVFILLEKFEPIASGIFQGMVLGAMVAEEGLLRLEIAFAPAIVAIEDFLASSNGMAIAGKAGMVAMGGLAAYAVVAAAPILAVGAAIAAVTAALDQFMKLQKEWDDQSSSQVWTKFKHDIGVTSDAEFSKEQGKRSGMVTGAEYDKLHPPAPPVPKPKPAEAAAAGTDTGAALGTGIVAGMKGKEAEVAAAGAGLAKAADKGVREAAKIHSPSRLMREKGRFMGDGLEEGLEDSKAGVQNSASSNLVPGVGGAGGGMGGGEKHFHFDFSGLTSGNKEDIEEVCRRVINEEVWKMAVQAGAPA